MLAEIAALKRGRLDPLLQAVAVNVSQGPRAEAGRDQGVVGLLFFVVADLARLVLHISVEAVERSLVRKA